MLDPTQYPAYLDAQRKQQLAQMLMGSLQQSENSPNPSTGISGAAGAVTPRRGIFQSVAPLVGALMAAKAQKSALGAQQQYMQGLYGGSPQPAAPAQPSPTDTAASQGPPAPGAAPAPSGLVQQPSQNPMIPKGMTPGHAQALLAMMGPETYAKTYLAGTPEWQNALTANNGDANAAMAQLKAEANVKGTTHMRQGEDIVLPNGTTIRNPVLGPGETLSRDAQGNPQSVSLIPGAAEAAGTLKGVTTAADVANTPREVPIGGGATRLMYPGQVPGLGAPPGAPSAQSAYAQATAPPQAPAPSAPAPAPPSPSASSQPIPPTHPIAAPHQPPGLPQVPNGLNYNQAWQNIPKLSVPTTPGQTSDARTLGKITNANAKDKELSDQYGQQSALADQQIQYNNEAMKALPSAAVGPMSDWLTTNRSKLVEMGVPANLIPSSGTVTPTLELNKYLLNSALQGARQIYGSRMTQNEVKLQTEEMSPSSHMTADAIQSLIGQNNVQANYTKQRAQDYSKFTSQGGDPMQFESWYATNRPLGRYVAASSTPPSAIERLHSNPALLSDFKSKYGWDPTQ